MNANEYLILLSGIVIFFSAVGLATMEEIRSHLQRNARP